MKDQAIIVLALVVIYIGIYTLRSNDVPDAHATDARWAGFFAVTFGVFSILTLLFKQPQVTGTGLVAKGSTSVNLFSLVALGSLLASAFFNFKLARAAAGGSLFQYLIYGQIVAHVLLLVIYVMGMNRERNQEEAFRSGSLYGAGVATGANTVLPNQVPVAATPSNFAAMSPRMPMRAR